VGVGQRLGDRGHQRRRHGERRAGVEGRTMSGGADLGLAHLRVARPTDDLEAVVRFYRDGLGLDASPAGTGGQRPSPGGNSSATGNRARPAASEGVAYVRGTRP
jgi:hypothetical protein